MPSSSEGNRVGLADLLRGDLVDRDAGLDVGPSVLSGWAPVRKLASDRAWSPPPSPWASPPSWARPVRTSRSSLNAASGSRIRAARSPAPPPRASSGHVDAVGDVEEGHPPGRRPRRPRPPAGDGRAPSLRARGGRPPCRGRGGPSAARSAGHGSWSAPFGASLLERVALDDLRDQPRELVAVAATASTILSTTQRS